MRRLIPVSCLLALLAVPASARADEERRVSATGGITVTWRGDPARGCAEQGVCDMRGSVVLDPTVDQGTSTSSGPGDYLPLVSVDLEPGIVRVVRGPASDPLGVCVDVLGGASFSLVPETERRGRTVVLTPSVGFGESVLSAGRCAGPTVSDLAEPLPKLKLPRSAFGKPLQRFDYTARRTLGAGPFTVEIDSTMKVAVRRRQVRGEPDSVIREPSERVRFRRRTVLEARYAVEQAGPPMTTSFSGLAGRGCEVLDACGVSGTTTVGLAPGQEGRLDIVALGPASLARGGRVGPALAALAAGRMTVESVGGSEALRGRVDAEVRRENSSAVCRDGRVIDLPPAELSVGRTKSRLTLGGESYGSDPGLLRTRCPGPSGRSSGAVASGTFPTRNLAGTQLTVPLGLDVGDTWPFAVSTYGPISLSLRRVSARVRTERVPVG